jgi:hypothetical protein
METLHNMDSGVKGYGKLLGFVCEFGVEKKALEGGK